MYVVGRFALWRTLYANQKVMPESSAPSLRKKGDWMVEPPATPPRVLIILGTDYLPATSFQ